MSAEFPRYSMLFGMPKVAIELGAAQQVLPLNKIGAAVFAALGSQQANPVPAL